MAGKRRKLTKRKMPIDAMTWMTLKANGQDKMLFVTTPDS
jgi:hypothetical protein